MPVLIGIWAIAEGLKKLKDHFGIKLKWFPTPVPLPATAEDYRFVVIAIVLIAYAKGSFDIYAKERHRTVPPSLAVKLRFHKIPKVVGSVFGKVEITENAFFLHASGGTAYGILLQPIAGFHFHECPRLTDGEEQQIQFVRDNTQSLIWDMRRGVNNQKQYVAQAPIVILFADRATGEQSWTSKAKLSIAHKEVVTISKHEIHGPTSKG